MLIVAIDAVVREATLFAALWFLVGGIDDLLVDLVYLTRRLRRRPDDLAAAPAAGGRIAIFVPAWDESAVIAAMLRSTLARYGAGDFALYVGTYPNDPDTIRAVAAVAEEDARVRLVIGPLPGPTTKADCLNALWRALLRDEAAEGWTALGVALHDAEDVVHPGELAVYAAGLARYDAVQLPVLPLPHPRSRFVSGHYADEFAEAHGKQLLVRQALGAGLPLAGVGCAVRRTMLAEIAGRRGGAPFDASSLTEDYELGLTIAALGGSARLLRVAEAPGGPPVAVRAYFPDTLPAAVRQKARWLTGIALAGWDRTGWGAAHQIGDHWMRMRDRRVTLAMPVLAVGYLALVGWGVSLVLHAALGSAPAALAPWMEALLLANLGLLGWRLIVRAAFVARAYGWREAILSVPRMAVGNYIGLLAARRAMLLYARLLAGAPPRWDKTAHEFPGEAPQAAR